ncbi:MAG: NAD-dependent epimerase/dehydratase family protein [Candidatus Eisenbacteria bacterium]|jgi:dTDP-L-rhamnose 4-epimerase|nr:NAD-dependent epimerase/dehydratase family protein [Candidatus Eisenbacteria bacterium]
MAVVLVTGGAGFIGSHLVDALVARGHEVRVLDSLEPQVHGFSGVAPDYLNSAALFHRGRIEDPATLAAVLPGVDVVFHEAAIVGVGQSMYEIRRYVDGNTGATGAFLEFLVHHPELRPRKLVVASSMSIYGEGAYRGSDGAALYPHVRSRQQLENRVWEIMDDHGQAAQPQPTGEQKPLHPTSIYAVTKRDHEEMCLAVGYAYRMPTVALRYFNVYGPRQALSNPYTGVGAIFSARLLNNKPPLVFEDGCQTRDFVHVSDIVQANILAMESDAADYRAVNVGTGTPTSVLGVASLLSEHLGYAGAPLILGKFREGDIRHCVADITCARHLLGYRPTVALHEGIPELVRWVSAQRDVLDGTDRAADELRKWGLTE